MATRYYDSNGNLLQEAPDDTLYYGKIFDDNQPGLAVKFFARGAAESVAVADEKNAAARAKQALSDAATAQSAADAAQSDATEALNRSVYATCDTAAATINKVATVTPATSDFVLEEGVKVAVRFLRNNTATSPKLDVNETGAYQIRCQTGVSYNNDAMGWKAGQVVSFVFNGTYWMMEDANGVLHASEAAKVATNYIDFVTGLGLVVANMLETTLGRNVLISAQDVQIRDGDTVLATFADSLIELGKNSSAAVIDLCNGTAQMKYDSATDIFSLISTTVSTYLHGGKRAGLVAESGANVASVVANATAQSVVFTAGAANGKLISFLPTGINSNAPWPIYGKEFKIASRLTAIGSTPKKVPFTSVKKTLPSIVAPNTPTFNVQSNEIVCSAGGTVMVTYSLWVQNIVFGDNIQTWVRVLHPNGTYEDECVVNRVVAAVVDVMAGVPTAVNVSAGDKLQVYMANYTSASTSVEINSTRFSAWYIG